MVGNCGSRRRKGGRHLGVVDHPLREALVVQGAWEVGCPAVAVTPCLGRRRWSAPLDHLGVVLGDHPGHVCHRPVGDFHGVPVDD